jgi:predicted dinucleotide-binding enzyme
MRGNFMRTAIVFLAAVIFGHVTTSVHAATIAIVGTGNVAEALGPRFAELGHTIIYGSREPNRADVQALVQRTGHGAQALAPAVAAAAADAIVLAIPWDAAEAVVKSLGNVSGKVIIDPTNPRHIAEDGLRDYAFDGSNAERIQQWAPAAHVVKAFNTMTAGLMTNPASAGGPVTVALAGDDSTAKAFVAELAQGIGFDTMDFGPVRYAHVIEGMFYVWGNARQTGTPFEFFMRRPPSN